MPFSKISQFEKSFPAVKELTPEQKQKALDVYNGIMEKEGADEGVAIATALKQAKAMVEKKMDEEEDDIDEVEEEELGENFQYVQVLEEAGQKISTIEILKTGKVHGRGFSVTKEMLNDFVTHYKEGVYGTDIQVNLRHDRAGEAAGWIKDLFVKGEKLLAKVEWTPLGVEKIKSKQFRFTSSELSLSHKNHEGKTFKNVLIGVALTNIPQIKGMKEVTLSEQAKTLIHNHKKMDKLKNLHELLMSFEGITKAQFKQFSETADAAIEAGEATKEDAKALLSELEAKVQEPAVESKQDLSENYVSKEEFLAAQEKNAELQEKVEAQELSEFFDSKLALSEDNKVGFNKDEKTKEKVTAFLKDLSQDQRTEFTELLSMALTVDLSERGSEHAEKKVTLSEDAIVEKTDEILSENPGMDAGEAQKQAIKELSKA